MSLYTGCPLDIYSVLAKGRTIAVTNRINITGAVKEIFRIFQSIYMSIGIMSLYTGCPLEIYLVLAKGRTIAVTNKINI